MIFFLANKILKLLAKLSSKNKYEFASDMSDEDAVRNVGYLAHSLRKTARSGAGVPVYPIRLALRGCRKTVLVKKKQGQKVYDFEEWISDNFRLLVGALDDLDLKGLATAPHVDGLPRIVVLADFIVKYSGGKVTRDRVKTVVEAFDAVTPLSYMEIALLRDAIAYRLLAEISFFAERSMHYRASYLRAKKGRISTGDRCSDSYMSYFAALYPERLSNGDRTEFAAATLGFENLIADNLLLTSSYVNSLRALPGELDKGFIVSLAPVDRIYLREESYCGMSDLAKHDYLMQTAKCASKNAVSEQAVGRACLAIGKALNLHFGEILYYYPEALRKYLRSGVAEPLRNEKTKVQGVYSFLVLFISLVIAAFPAYYLRNLWAYLSVLPLFIASLHPVEYLLKRFYGAKLKQKPLPQMNYKTLPEACRTAVVVSRFISSKKDAEDALFQAETLASQEKDAAVSFVILADLPSSEEEWGEADQTLLEQIKTLPRSDRVTVCLRKRIRCGKKWGGYERKRGALLDFLSAVEERDFGKFYLIGREVQAQYAVLLDDDSELLPGTLSSAILAMAHPLNREYDLMSFGGKINGFSIKTHYGLRFLRGCGAEAYPCYSDFYANAFDSALYCGKAIVRIGKYVKKLKDFFPDGRILSHDVIEGAVLRSTSLKRCVYEDAPATFAADHRRASRWQRGDVQLLPYAFCDRVKTKSGKRVKNPIAPIYKLIIFINGMSVLREFATLAVLLLSYFSGNLFLFYYAISCHLFVKAYALIGALRVVVSNVRFSQAFRGVVFAIELLTDEILLLPFRAISGAYLFFITCFKMVVRSDSLLDWTPFRRTQQTGGAADCAKVLFPTTIVLTALSFVFGNLWFTLYVAVFFLYSFYLFLSGRPLKTVSLGEKRAERLKSYAAKIYRYFEDNRTEGLITDNLQLFPYRMKSAMTSPTNLGFALLAEVCACKLGMIPVKTAIRNLKEQLDKIERLERKDGHLYNWYDINTFAVLPPKVVSTVDSANFLCCLRVVAAFLKEEGAEDLCAIAEKLISEADFSTLYDKGEKCLAIVRQCEEERLYGRYDLFASESRLAYYLAIAEGVDPDCYFRLGRDCTSVGGNTLLSWSGTAFEYMLPRLFLKAPVGSLIARQEVRSGAMQIRDKTDGVFGRSECGYYAFNDATAYLYKAVGCRSLALSGESSDVLAPYASFLYLPCFPQRCMDNLKAFSDRDAEGEYGFYEAVDYDHRGAIVKSYMTHHQGMSIAAVTNALCKDEIVRLFCSSPAIASIRILLTEADVCERKQRYLPMAALPPKRSQEVCSVVKAIPDTLAVSLGEYRATYDALGRSGAMLGSFCLTKTTEHRPEYGGIFVQVKEGDRVTSPAFYPTGTPACRTIFCDGVVKYVNDEDHLTLEVRPLAGYQGELRKLIIENPGDTERSLTVSVYADMVLNTKDAYDSHPAFSDMFVSAEYDENTRSAYLFRKDTNCEVALSASLTAKGLTDVKVNCNSYNVIGRKGGVCSDFERGIESEAEPHLGDVLYPCFGIKGKVIVPPRGKATTYFCLLADRDPDTLKQRNVKIDLAYRSGAIDLLGRTLQEQNVVTPFELALTGRLLYARTPQSVLAARMALRDELLSLGVAPEEDLLYFDVGEEPDRQKLFAAVKASGSLLKKGVLHKFVIVCENLAGAGMDAVDALKKQVASLSDAVFVLNRDGGAIFRPAAKIILSQPLAEMSELPLCEDLILPEEGEESKVIFPCGEGGFTGSGYAVRPFGTQTLLPYVNVVGGEKGGFVITESGGGFTFGENSREDKFTVWTGDAVGDRPSEVLSVRIGNVAYALNTAHCEHQVGSTVFTHRISGVTARTSVSLFENGRAKLYETLFTGDLPEGAALSLRLIPALGWRFCEKVLVRPCEKGYELTNVQTDKRAYVYSPDGSLTVKIPVSKCNRLEFVLATPVKKGIYRFILSFEKPACLTERDLAASKAKCLATCTSNALTVKTQDVWLNLLNDHLLPYQVKSSRLNAKTGFYQCGGAYGFRDQLQDTLALLLSDPARVRFQIMLAAAHQYEEGDVQHWWHPPMTGVRTRISDDRLWLVYLTERYVETTGDHAILDQAVSFLSSPILSPEETSRYEIPREGEVATLREHLIRAIRITLQYGEHGLLKIGTGDWNDGLDRVGARGRGESVWLTMFAYKTIKDALNFFSESVRSELLRELKKLSSALLPLLKQGRYPLAFADDGKWLGYSDTSACRIALNPQTWAVLSGAVPLGDAKRALSTAKDLADGAFGIVKLSSLPFDKHANYGYIAAYPKGVRENGGQYTHAAVWYLKALLEAGEKEEAYRILAMLAPVERCQSKDGTLRYKAEPYVLAGDVYGSVPYVGRAGWTWYTGSAAWLKYVLTEDFFGIKKRGDFLYVSPKFPSCYREASAVLKLSGRTINVRYQRESVPGLYLDGTKVEKVDLSELGENVNLLCGFD